MEASLRIPEAEAEALYGNKLQQQLELEARMVTLGRDQIRKAIARAREKGNESGTSYSTFHTHIDNARLKRWCSVGKFPVAMF